MSWIKTIKYRDSSSKLRKLYDKIKGPDNQIDNVLTIHSLRPHTLEGHMILYKNVLHHASNKVPKWYLEALGVVVSYINKCDYCFEHHYVGFTKLVQNEIETGNFKKSLKAGRLDAYFDKKYYQGVVYAQKLTLNPADMIKEDVGSLKGRGFSDGEILEINQVVSYFNYVNRSVLGLGVTTEGDVLGLSPNDSDDPNSWRHL